MRTLFAGDAHIGAGRGSRERERYFLSLLERGGEFDRVVLMGDVFDFWFEYGRVVPADAVRLLSGFSRLSSVSEVFYVRGNHDLWAGKGLARWGVKVLKGEYREGGVVALHGDTLVGRKERATRSLFQNPLAIRAYRCLHPDIGVRLAKWVSRRSRVRSADTLPDRALLEAAAQKYPGASLVVLGHFHVPFIERVGNTLVACPGDLLNHFTHAELDGERLRIVGREGGVVAEETLPPQ